MKLYGASDTGLVRSENQDAYRIEKLTGPADYLAVLCDGMGGAAGGRIASCVATDAFVRRIREKEPELSEEAGGTDSLAVRRIFADAVYYANQSVFEQSVLTPQLKGMGTTLSAALFLGDRLFLANIGDSRAYLFREGRLVQLTHDDSYVQQLVDAGRLTEGEAARHRDRNLLVRALGTEPYTDFGFAELTLDSGDRILLCSDGLSACRSDRDIAGFLRLADPCRETAEALICAAKDAGGPDNITVILADI